MFHNKYFRLIRIHQWVKNFFIFFPLFFSGLFIEFDKIVNSVLAFTSFCFISSAMYIFNDLKDIESDRNHPKKKNRPLASGQITSTNAIVIGTVFTVIAFILGFFLNIWYLTVVILYIGLNLIYSNLVKNLAVLDIVSLAFFYIIRIYAGAAAIVVEVSSWLLLTSFFAALFLGSGKRYVEFIAYGNKGRKVLAAYSKEFLLYCLFLSSFCTILFYTLYTTTRSFYFQLSSIFVVLGFLNYFYLLFKGNIDEDPVVILLRTNSIRVILMLWVVFLGVVIYLDL